MLTGSGVLDQRVGETAVTEGLHQPMPIRYASIKGA